MYRKKRRKDYSLSEYKYILSEKNECKASREEVQKSSKNDRSKLKKKESTMRFHTVTRYSKGDRVMTDDDVGS